MTKKLPPCSSHCHLTGRPFRPGELVYTILRFPEDTSDPPKREDYSESAWETHRESFVSLSFWRFHYQEAPAEQGDAQQSQFIENASRALERLAADVDPSPSTVQLRYVLALLLERKKVLRQIDTQRQDPSTHLLFEWTDSREVLQIEEPSIQLADLPTLEEEIKRCLTMEE